MGLLDKLRGGLAKTRDVLAGGLRKVLFLGRTLDEALITDLEEVLIKADVGPKTTAGLLDELRAAWKSGEVKKSEEVAPFLERRVAERLRQGGNALVAAPVPPTVILVCGVNGSGKTTSIGKLTKWLKREGHRVVLGAADTFRAAAVEQLTIWSERNGVEIVKQAQGSDPAAVAFDAASAGRARKADYVVIDTAGRLHTQQNLMQELEKIRRAVRKAIPDGPHETLLVIDATNGQNAIRQAEQFHKVVGVTGIFVTKLDGTAKGGALIAVRDTIHVPVKFIGTGEQIDDIEAFDADAFASALFRS
ncbi:MAG TPA: signal recognition particle-docking protein FtsY [Planctomycetota bacterium]|nr:signal recognition particle-docking protein FtsY [Planctomycetota bacterium]